MAVAVIGSYLIYRILFFKSLLFKPLFGAICILALILCFFGVKELKNKSKSKILPYDVSVAVGAYQLFRNESFSQNLYRAKRLPLVSSKLKAALNIVVIINESWDKLYVPFYTGQNYKAIYPFLNNLVRQKGVFVFQHAFSNSSATDVSVPSIISGVGSHERNIKLHTLPLLWDLAHAAGMKTAYISSQRASWNGMKTFMNSPGPDFFFSADEIPSPIVNDLGIDDLEAVKKVQDVLSKLKKEDNFLLVYNTNALHAPFQNNSISLHAADFGDRRKNANYIVDQTIQKIFEYFRDSGRLESTLFVITADHGLGRGISNGSRIFSYYDEFINIPFVVCLPPNKQLFNDSMIQNLIVNSKEKNIANIDIGSNPFFS